MKLIFGIVTIFTLLVGCENSAAKKNAVRNSDVVVKKEESTRFKEELERLNDSSKVHVSIPDDARIVYTNEDSVLALENGIVLFGWPKCPWFRNAIGPLLEFAKEEHATIYYLNIHDIRDKKELENGQVITTEAGSKGYQAILRKFHDILNPYAVLGVDSIKRISSPTVLYVENGKAVYKVVSTVVSQTDAAQKLDSTQREELKQRYRKYFTQEFEATSI
ncbi:hypothetical protein [Sphingobacterium sp. LRF_L2]|uniref:hypothetical protein n=1 Tax=Sphingobacterium sp. LRF_L2 TaxID=3369421 RepID=UPI003F61580F